MSAARRELLSVAKLSELLKSLRAQNRPRYAPRSFSRSGRSRRAEAGEKPLFHQCEYPRATWNEPAVVWRRASRGGGCGREVRRYSDRVKFSAVRRGGRLRDRTGIFRFPGWWFARTPLARRAVKSRRDRWCSAHCQSPRRFRDDPIAICFRCPRANDQS